jgi:HAD superfamily hydrolase (TIGR01549 family)
MADAIVFDIDGTLVDSVDLHAKAWQEAFGRFGFDIPYDRVRSQIGKGSDQLIPSLLPEEAVKEHGEAIDEFRGDLFKRRYLPQVRSFPAVQELFERIQADGTPIVLASSAKRDELEAYLRITGVGDLIEGATSSDDADRSKPHPDIFEAAVEKLSDIDRARVVVVGDTPYDAQAAAMAGLVTVGLRCGGWSEEELLAAGCIAVYRDPAELLRHYDHSPLAHTLSAG